MKGSEVRERFLAFFEGKGHRRVRSAPLVPRNDPTLFFTNAGMVPFKDVFLGREKRDYVRATSSQKCMRVSGKHNDLENVGRTPRHHTFFEMLGNFSFGDYFKEEAIAFAWEFMTGDLKLDRDRLVVTIFREDDEAGRLWEKAAKVPAERIIRLGEKDNFWAMGETGPCGPCSEIHVDTGRDRGCGRPGCDPSCDCGRFMEIWNLVFMQFERDEKGALTPLPKPSIDTGMGLERLTAVLQKVPSNYDTDLLRPFLDEASGLAGVPYGKAPASDVSLRVIADHVRAVTFLVADGVLPSNEGRGYVLRRIMRRAARHGKLLGMDGPFLCRMAPLVVERMGEVYPELGDNREMVLKVVQHEEERFAQTLDQGLARLSEMVEKVKKAGGKLLPGPEVFRLYDTYGFPLDLSQDMAAENGLGVDVPGFEEEMARQKERARSAWTGSGEDALSPHYRDLREKSGPVRFTGYEETERAGARVKSLSVGGRLVGSFEAPPGMPKKGSKGGTGPESVEVEIVLDATPFYGESGGQAGDTGVLEGEGFHARVTGTKKPVPDLIVHLGLLAPGGLVRVGDAVVARVDSPARTSTARNHTATHLLHAALRDLLGEHVKQSGSLVDPGRLRFDFTHFASLTPEEVREVEDQVNGAVLRDLPVDKRVMSLEQAVKDGAMALFGEKYGETVRVISIPGVSRELCGGTHVDRTGEIGLFKVVQEGSVAAGVRRIEAVTGSGVLELVRAQERETRDLADALKVPPGELSSRVRKLADTVRHQEKKIRELQKGMAGGGADLLQQVREAGGTRFLAAELPGQDPASLREAAEKARDRLGDGVVLLATRDEKKAFLVCVVSRALEKRFPAGELIRRLAPLVGGGGGGRPDMAQAGGKDPAGLPALLAGVEEILKEMAK